MSEEAPSFTPVTFVKTGEAGTAREVLASSPAEAVRLRFDGWSEKPSSGRSTSSRPTATTTSN